jgi:Ca2+-binding RTX toxin-like protein
MELETLDGRKLFNVTVSEGYPGFYDVQGDASANSIDITVSMHDETFTLNGTTYSGVKYIFVQGQDNNDVISVRSSDGAGSIGASISSGGGDDNVTLNFDGGVWAGDGNDTINLSNSYRGQAYGQAGNDRINVSGECIDPDIDGGDGDDVVDCSSNHYGVIARGGAGNDTVIGSPYDDQIYGDEGSDVMYGNGGHDSFDADANDHIATLATNDGDITDGEVIPQ